MLTVIRSTWALQIGILMLMMGNGMHGTLLGVRGATEFGSTTTMAWIMSGYFVGFLGGSKLAPKLIRRVGHVRVFAALGSLISAALILFAAIPNALVWMALRVIIGFCFSGVYVVAESWLNDKSTNETRGKVLSVYIIVQMIGIVAAQGVLNFGDPNGYFLFVIASVLVSVSFAPILLSVSPAPIFEATSPMSIRELIRNSPLGAFGSLCLGALFSALWGMSSVYGTNAGLSLGEISLFVAFIYIGGMLCQYPVGWLSDRLDRRKLIAGLSLICAVVTGAVTMFAQHFYLLLAVAFVMGGMTNPLYSLIIAYTNDFLKIEDMAAGAGCLIFINGAGAIFGPLAVGVLMGEFGPNGFYLFICMITILLAVFALYRMTVRSAAPIDQLATFTPVSQGSTPVAVDMVQEWAIDQQEGDLDSDNDQPTT